MTRDKSPCLASPNSQHFLIYLADAGIAWLSCCPPCLPPQSLSNIRHASCQLLCAGQRHVELHRFTLVCNKWRETDEPLRGVYYLLPQLQLEVALQRQSNVGLQESHVTRHTSHITQCTQHHLQRVDFIVGQRTLHRPSHRVTYTLSVGVFGIC